MRGKMALYSYLYSLSIPNDTGTSDFFKKPSSSSGLQLYPNPTSGMFRMSLHPDFTKSDEYTLKIFNLFGQLQMFARSTLSSESTYNVSHLPAGIYIVSIDFKGKTETAKLTINH
jgi:hypothetical protein